MYILQTEAAAFVETTREYFYSTGVHNYVPSKTIDDYLDFLDPIIEKSQYKEGDKISTEDLSTINDKVNSILTDLKDNMVSESMKATKGQRGKGDCLSNMLNATEYLYALTMQALGCPDMPTAFGDEVKNKITELAETAEFDIKAADYEKTTTDKIFKLQRKKDATEVRSKTDGLGTFITTKKATPLDVAKYAAEYQALKQRQERHTGFWRFFHKSENIRRTELLNEMKEVLNSALGPDVDFDTKSPLDIAKAYNSKLIKTSTDKVFKEGSIAERYKSFKDSVRFEGKVNNIVKDESDKEKTDLINENESRQNMHLEQSEVDDKNNEITFSNKVEDVPQIKEISKNFAN